MARRLLRRARGVPSEGGPDGTETAAASTRRAKRGRPGWHGACCTVASLGSRAAGAGPGWLWSAAPPPAGMSRAPFGCSTRHAMRGSVGGAADQRHPRVPSPLQTHGREVATVQHAPCHPGRPRLARRVLAAAVSVPSGPPPLGTPPAAPPDARRRRLARRMLARPPSVQAAPGPRRLACARRRRIWVWHRRCYGVYRGLKLPPDGVSCRRMKILIAPESGSLQGETASRNRYGQYRRSRATPVNPNSTAQGTVRARMSLNAAAWRALTDAQRAGWESLGLQMVRTDSLGQSYSLNGFGAYCSVNNNLLAAGDAVVSDAPALVTPSTLATVTLTLTSIAFSVAYTPTPLEAGERIFVYCSPQRTLGRSFEGDLRLIHVSAAAAASPANVLAAYTARFGAPVTGNKIFLSIHNYLGGFRSGPFFTSAEVQ